MKKFYIITLSSPSGSIRYVENLAIDISPVEFLIKENNNKRLGEKSILIFSIEITEQEYFKYVESEKRKKIRPNIF
jgi:hypothetical protein